MNNGNNVVFNIEFAWWLKLYIGSLILFCRIFNTVPDEDKLKKNNE